MKIITSLLAVTFVWIVVSLVFQEPHMKTFCVTKENMGTCSEYPNGCILSNDVICVEQNVNYGSPTNGDRPMTVLEGRHCDEIVKNNCVPPSSNGNQ
jgi:hypothetical protein